MAYGITETGFVVKPLEVGVNELNAKFRSLFGNGADLTPSEPLGQIIGAMAERLDELWQALQASHVAHYPDSAGGAALVEVCALTGTIPRDATRSLVNVILTGTAGTVIAAGKQAAVEDAATLFENTEDVTLAAVTAQANLAAITLGDLRKSGGNVYQAIQAGTTGTGTPPVSTTPGSDEADGSVHWTFLGAGVAAVSAQFQAVDVGPLAANAYALNVIHTPVSGWQGVVNLADADPGRGYETDSTLRLRREIELRAQGKAAADSVRADVLATVDADGAAFVSACKVFINNTDAVDGDGLAPHSINVVARYSGSPDSDKDDAIRASIFGSVAAGIATNGAVSGTVTDASGNDQEILFDRPTAKPVYLIIDATIDEDTFPADGSDQIKTALAAFGDLYEMGADVIVSHLYPAVLDAVTGVTDIAFRLGFAPAPAGTTNLTIAARELATIDTSDITVNLS